MDMTYAWNIANHLLRLRIEHGDRAVAEMGDEQQMLLRIQAFIIESCRGAGQRNVGHHPQHRKVQRCRLAGGGAAARKHGRTD